MCFFQFSLTVSNQGSVGSDLLLYIILLPIQIVQLLVQLIFPANDFQDTLAVFIRLLLDLRDLAFQVRALLF